ncbi:monocarboxylate transporter 12 isoform X3 [Rhipicephalus microplus]|uniref:monocarboxylate transporter 12 isoform X3 n=1 Tax=Rhipicephalus microplus TaxID=6941 RepID=UPI003F6C2A89
MMLYGVDSRQSWVVAAFSSWFLFMVCIGQRVFSIIYVGILEAFHVTRQEASWPMSTIDLLASLSRVRGVGLIAICAVGPILHLTIVCGVSCRGALCTDPIFGYLCSRFSCRAVLLWCGLAGPLGIILCYFAANVTFIAVSYGILNGVSISGTLTALTVVLAQHFDKRRATAYSVVFTISALNTFVLPPLVELFLSTYGLHGTFLVLGAICLNAFPAAIAIASPPETRGASPEELVTLRDDCKQRTAAEKSLSKEALKNFATLRFWVDSLSFCVMYLALSLYLTLAVDLAKDKGVDMTSAVFLLHAFSVGDVVFRGVSGFVLDSGALTSDGAMLLGFVLQTSALELLACSANLPMLLIGSLILGCGNGLRMPIAGVVLIGDFGLKLLPLVFGGFALVCGLNVWVRAPLIAQQIRGILCVIFALRVGMVSTDRLQ